MGMKVFRHDHGPHGAVLNSKKMTRIRLGLRFCLVVGICLTLALVVRELRPSWGTTHRVVDGWNKLGCPTKILDLTEGMSDRFKELGGMSGIEADLGNPQERKPRTAVLNMVSYHTEVVASLAYHFIKLRHNVTVFDREDALGIQAVILPWLWKGVKKFERFFESFTSFDTIVFVTFPTCHHPVLEALSSLKLPQRYITVIHNPASIQDENIVQLLKRSSARMLTIAPHVLAATERELSNVDPKVTLQSGWLVPIFPVIFTEECIAGSWKLATPPCSRVGNLEALLASSSSNSASQRVPEQQRSGVCVQGKMDPTRRNYTAIFDEILADKEQLRAMNFSLVLQGKGGGRHGATTLEVPNELLQLGLVRLHHAVPFQQYYDILHGCVAVLPAFASEAYYVDKGSSSIGTALIAGTPLIATPRLLKAYSFLTEEAVFLVEEDLSYVETLKGVLGLPPSVLKAKLEAVDDLRQDLLRSNLETLQDLVGPERLIKINSKGTKAPRDIAGEALWAVAETGRWAEQVESGQLLAGVSGSNEGGDEKKAQEQRLDQQTRSPVSLLSIGAWLQRIWNSTANSESHASS